MYISGFSDKIDPYYMVLLNTVFSNPQNQCYPGTPCNTKCIFHRIDHNKQNRYKTYDEAQEFCKNGTMNGFTTGRLLEPKTLSFLDKVYFESRIVLDKKNIDTWMGIVRINSTSYQGNKWVYASSGDDVNFQNWRSGKPNNSRPFLLAGKK